MHNIIGKNSNMLTTFLARFQTCITFSSMLNSVPYYVTGFEDVKFYTRLDYVNHCLARLGYNGRNIQMVIKTRYYFSLILCYMIIVQFNE